MELLHADRVRPEPGERVFRHGVLGPLVLWAFLVAPLAFAFAQRAALARLAQALPWPLWFVLVPVALVGGLLWLLCLHGVAQVVQRTFSPPNWLMRVSSSGLVLNLRSYQNAHFPLDGPTVVRFAWSEIARVRRARDVTPRISKHDGHGAASWLQLELLGVDTGALERLIAHERERPAPERSFFGIRGRGRFGHVPVFVAAPLIVRTDWLGARMLQALAAHAEVAEALRFDRSRERTGDLDAELGALLVRGDRMAAIELVRRRRGLSLLAAKKHVEALGHQAALRHAPQRERILVRAQARGCTGA